MSDRTLEPTICLLQRAQQLELVVAEIEACVAAHRAPSETLLKSWAWIVSDSARVALKCVEHVTPEAFEAIQAELRTEYELAARSAN